MISAARCQRAERGRQCRPPMAASGACRSGCRRWHGPVCRQCALDRGGTSISFTIFGIDPARPGFVAPGLSDDLDLLQVQGAVILDRLARGLPPDQAAAIRRKPRCSFEWRRVRTADGNGDLRGRRRDLAGGSMLTSNQTFLSLFASRLVAPRLTHNLAAPCAPGADVYGHRARRCGALNFNSIPAHPQLREDLRARGSCGYHADAGARRAWIFGFALLIGVLVGPCLRLSVLLSADVADHFWGIRYPFKAMVVWPRFFPQAIRAGSSAG